MLPFLHTILPSIFSTVNLQQITSTIPCTDFQSFSSVVIIAIIRVKCLD